MELAHFDEQRYLLKLQSYHTTFSHFKYEPSSFMYVEIGTNSRVPTMPYVVQPIIKPISPLRCGTCLEIIPLLV